LQKTNETIVHTFNYLIILYFPIKLLVNNTQEIESVNTKLTFLITSLTTLPENGLARATISQIAVDWNGKWTRGRLL